MINWGIIGLGNMANQFANAINEVEDAKLIAVASRSKYKLENFHKNFKIEKKNLFQNYKDIINCRDLDAVYISTLNNTHFELIKFLSDTKIKIFCEKPFVINHDEAKEVALKITKNQNNFFEAIAYRAHPQTNKILEIINNDEIGEIKKITSNFGFKVRKIRKKSRLFNKEIGGGVLLDLGCYPISFTRLFLNNNSKIDINKVNGSVSVTGVEDYAELKGFINEKIEIEFKISFRENMENCCMIYGSKGTLKVPSPWLPEKKTYVEIIKPNSYYKKFISCNKSVYANQIDLVSNEFLNNNKFKVPLVGIDESVEISNTLSQWRSLI